MENKEQLQERLASIIGTLKYNGGVIEFINNNESVGQIQLPSFTTMECRHILAELADVKEYDNFLFKNEAGEIRVDASKTFMTNLVMEEDIEINRGLYEGIKYQFYKNKINCDKCGSTRYTAIHPEQSDLVEKLYKKSSTNL